jgi:C_GCAxxG_C_C family probable redox protein
MNDQADYAEALFKQGFNCAQSVFAAFHDDLGIEQDIALRIASSFGGGMGRLREVCGALTGLFMAAGIKYGYLDPNDLDGKTRHYQLVQDFAQRFSDEYHSILCRDLLQLDEKISEPTPEVRTAAYYHRRPCAEYVRFAAGLLEKMPQLEETQQSISESM